jgi:hypothetical protein
MKRLGSDITETQQTLDQFERSLEVFEEQLRALDSAEDIAQAGDSLTLRDGCLLWVMRDLVEPAPGQGASARPQKRK